METSKNEILAKGSREDLLARKTRKIFASENKGDTCLLPQIPIDCKDSEPWALTKTRGAIGNSNESTLRQGRSGGKTKEIGLRPIARN
jgi:hypothetical protein